MCIVTIATLKDIFIKTKTNPNLSFYHSFLGTWPFRLYLILCPLILFRDLCTEQRSFVTLSCSTATFNFSARIDYLDYNRGISRFCKVTSSVLWLPKCFGVSCVLGLDLNPPCRQSGWDWHFNSQVAVGEGAWINVIKEEKFHTWILISFWTQFGQSCYNLFLS